MDFDLLYNQADLALADLSEEGLFLAKSGKIISCQPLGTNDEEVEDACQQPAILGFDGTWVEPPQEELDDGGELLYHYIEGKTLYWADGAMNALEKCSASVIMERRGVVMSGALRSDSSELEWSGGSPPVSQKIWRRADCQGSWRGDQEGGSDLVHCVKNWTLSALMMSGSGKAEICHQELAHIGPNSLSLLTDAGILKAKLSPLGQRLFWSDGQVWTRLSANPAFDMKNIV
jgi:hypothetical protein